MFIGMIGAAIGIGTSVAIAGLETQSNAALMYYRAWLDMDSEVQSTLQISDDSLSLAPNGVELLERSDETIESLLAASQMGNADWQVAYDEGPFAKLPHLGKMRTATKILAADALRCAQDAEPEQAAERVVALYRMSGQITKDRLLISSLVGMAIENLANDLTTQLIEDEQLGSEGAQRVLNAIQERGLEDRFSMRDAIVGEWRMISEFLVSQLPKEQPGVWLIEGLGLANDSEASKRIMAMKRSEILRELGGFSQYHGDVLAAWDADDRDALQEAESRVESGAYGPVTELFGASMTRAFRSHQQFIAETQSLINLLKEAQD